MPAKKTTNSKIELKLKDTTVPAVDAEQRVSQPTEPSTVTPVIPSIAMKTEKEESKIYDPMNEVLARLEKLESENKALKEAQEARDENIFKKRREKYNGPHKYSYKIWEGQPIIGFKTLQMRQERDWQKGGKYITLHEIELSLASGKKVVTDYDSFSQNYGKSEKLFVDEVIDRGGKKFYKFSVDGASFEVADNVIN